MNKKSVPEVIRNPRPRHSITMRHILAFTIALPLLALALPACDSPDNEAQMQALDLEDDVEAQTAQDRVESRDTGKPSFEGFDLEASMTPAAGPPGKCCKAICTWKPGWQQLPWQVTENCNDYARLYCGYYNVVDAQWRTCG